MEQTGNGGNSMFLTISGISFWIIVAITVAVIIREWQIRRKV